jgi:hypothetical protein
VTEAVSLRVLPLDGATLAQLAMFACEYQER